MGKSLENYTVSELKQKCRDLKIKGYSNMKKNELVKACREHNKGHNFGKKVGRRSANILKVYDILSKLKGTGYIVGWISGDGEMYLWDSTDRVGLSLTRDITDIYSDDNSYTTRFKDKEFEKLMNDYNKMIVSVRKIRALLKSVKNSDDDLWSYIEAKKLGTPYGKHFDMTASVRL